MCLQQTITITIQGESILCTVHPMHEKSHDNYRSAPIVITQQFYHPSLPNKTVLSLSFVITTANLLLFIYRSVRIIIQKAVITHNWPYSYAYSVFPGYALKIAEI